MISVNDGSVPIPGCRCVHWVISVFLFFIIGANSPLFSSPDSSRQISILAPKLQSRIRSFQTSRERKIQYFTSLLRESRQYEPPFYPASDTTYRHISELLKEVYDSFSPKEQRRIREQIRNDEGDGEAMDSLETLLHRAEYEFPVSEGEKAIRQLYFINYRQGLWGTALFWARILKKLRPEEKTYKKWFKNCRKKFESRIQSEHRSTKRSGDRENLDRKPNVNFVLWNYPARKTSSITDPVSELRVVQREPYFASSENEQRRKKLRIRELRTRETVDYFGIRSYEPLSHSDHFMGQWEPSRDSLLIGNGKAITNLSLSEFQVQKRNGEVTGLLPQVLWTKVSNLNEGSRKPSANWKSLLHTPGNAKIVEYFSTNRNSIFYVLGNKLYKGRLSTGEVLWKQKPPGKENNEDLRFHGAPHISGNRVITVLFNEIREGVSWEVQVVSFSARNGKVLWKTTLGEINEFTSWEDRKNQKNEEKRRRTVLESFEGGVFLGSNFGLSAMISVLSGRILWIRKHQFVSSGDRISFGKGQGIIHRKDRESNVHFHFLTGEEPEQKKRLNVRKKNKVRTFRENTYIGDNGIVSYIKLHQIKRYLPGLPFENKWEFIRYSSGIFFRRVRFRQALQRFMWRARALEKLNHRSRLDHFHLGLMALVV